MPETKVYDLLYRLGATANYTGFFHMAYALSLCTELHHLAGGPAPAGRTGAQTSGAETPKRPDVGHSGLVTGYRASGGSWTV